MVEDTPHDLVHDLAAEAVFGAHPLGRPVIGRAEVISSVSRRALAGYHRRAYVGDQLVLAAAGNVRHDRLVALLEARRNGAATRPGPPARQPARRIPAPALRFLRKDDGAVPRLPRGTGHLARSTSAASRPRSSTRSSAAPPRRASSRRSARSAGWRTPCTATDRSTPTRARSASTSARARRTCRVPRDRGRGARRHRARERARRRARAGEGEPQGPPAALAGVDVRTG